ncbi:MAG: TonB-dependent receptor domain-containing protein [Flavobacteriaceae bacterium]
MKYNKLSFTLSAILLFCVNLMMAQSSIRGTVTDSETGDAIPGANVVIIGTNEGTTADFDGNFTLTTNQDLPFKIEITSIGFSSQSIEVTSADQSITVSMNPGESLDEIIVSASRRPQKLQEVPASVSLISSKDIENNAQELNPVRLLVNTPGVQIQQHSLNSINVEMRAGSGLFGTSTFPILDYRYLATPAADSFFSYSTGISNIDIAKIEVVRGANSAMYGPSVTSGVVHFLTKSAIDSPGSTLELTGGSMDTRGINFRHARSNKSKTFGYKFNLNYQSGQDFSLDPEEDAGRIAGYSKTVSQPVIVNGQVANFQSQRILRNQGSLDPDGDNNPMAQEFKNVSANLHFEYRPNDDTEMVFSNGWSNFGGMFFNALGPGYTAGNDYWTQFRMQKGGLFAQAYYNYADGGDSNDPTFLYGTGLRQVADRSSVEAQIQYAWEAPSLLNTEFVVGADYRDTKSDSQNTLYGRYDDGKYQIFGAYVTANTDLTDNLKMTVAGRYDTFNYMDASGFSPRAALVWTPNPRHTFRASYNVGSFTPSALQMYIDFPLVNVAAPIPGLFGGMDIWLQGQTEDRPVNPNIMTALGELPSTTTGLPLAAVWGFPAPPSLLPPGVPVGTSLGALTQAGIFAQLAGTASGAVLQAPLTTFFTSVFDPTFGGGATGSLYPYNLANSLGELLSGGTNLTPWDQTQAGASSADIGYARSLEVGYKGLWGDKLSVAVDFYTYSRTGFTNYQSISPTYALLGADPATDLTAAAASQLTTFFSTNAQGQAAIQALTIGSVAPAFGINPTDIVAVGTALATNPAFAGAVAATQPAVLSQTVATVAAGFTAAGTTFDDNASALYPVFGVNESVTSPNDGIIHAAAGYRRNDATRSHFGTDVNLEYFATDNLTMYANASWLSQTSWIPGESNDDGLEFRSELQAPKFRARAGITYSGNTGLFTNIAYQHDDKIYGFEGVYTGWVPVKNLVDFSIGNRFDNFTLQLSATNLLNTPYRSFVNMPVIGRRVLMTARIDL